MKTGKQSFSYSPAPVIEASGTAGGPFEAAGSMREAFDILFDDLYMGMDSFEKAQQKLFETAASEALRHGDFSGSDMDLLFAGDLTNQMTSTTFAGRTLGIPYVGLFGACSTSMESLALAALTVASGGADRVLCGTSSHNAAMERQFRYPTEYGAQKPPTAQWTASAAGAAVIAAPNGKQGPVVTKATIGRVIDRGIADPFNMGAAMAPAAVDTIDQHFQDFHTTADDYDLILTGDLGRVGRMLALDLFAEKKIDMPEEKLQDAGLMIYSQNQPVNAGASGCGCSAAVTYGHIIKGLESGNLSKVLIAATGALLSPVSYQQGETIPCIAHAVVIEQPKGGGA
ncbi:stage V sporulation protein AD [Salsuginibacillus halophilus]|uniref:Stage V sporulation protein AD n=1 Tax=Salsuginibacillus halophilus TaxID=517424 RepID=A0A2P8HW53_9BACI|nr:stage V sporulation protein AD [Salsuginibacillus halophilus]PSL50405.1 stage V sporulation protein AD [Salsuginibacillus halophilus]